MKTLLALVAALAVLGTSSVFAGDCGGCCGGKDKGKEKPKDTRSVVTDLAA